MFCLPLRADSKNCLKQQRLEVMSLMGIGAVGPGEVRSPSEDMSRRNPTGCCRVGSACSNNQSTTSGGLLDKQELVKTNRTTAEDNKLYRSDLSVGEDFVTTLNKNKMVFVHFFFNCVGIKP